MGRRATRRSAAGQRHAVTLIGAGVIALDGAICRPGWLQTAGRRVVDCGPGSSPRVPDVDVPDAVVVPGFVDLHVHGGGGASYTDGTTADIERAAAFHRSHGTTTTLASLVTASPAELLAGLRALAESTRLGAVAGIHVEGPWLSPGRGGAHDVSQLRDPDSAEVQAVLAAGDGAVRMVTLAPERAGSAAAIKRLVDAGVVVAVGHTEATYQQTKQAIDAGATVGTHLFNAMAPLHHREPGPVLALLQDPRVTVELIADGVHVHPALVESVIAAVGPGRVALVTDATAAAGLGDGEFRLGSVQIDVVSGVARVRGDFDHRGQHRDHGSALPRRGGVRPGPGCGVGRRRADDRDDAGPCAWNAKTSVCCARAPPPTSLSWIMICT